MIAINIDVKKIDKSLLYEGKKGTYLSITLKDNKDGKDQYGNDGFVTQDVSREARESGVKGPIIGNWKEVGGKAPSKPKPRTPDPDLDGDSQTIPF